ncbi:MAG: hypothetical protein WBL61_09220 [Bryobacteraceae bacterium]
MAQDRKATLADSVAIGRDGWLFHRDNFAFEQMSAVKRLGEPEIAAWRDLLTDCDCWLRGRNSEFFFLIAPEKHAVYYDYLPPGSIVSDQRPASVLVRALSDYPRIRPRYPVEELRAGRASRDTYHAVGTHWNYSGGFIAYRELASEIVKRVRIPVLDTGDLTFGLSQPHAADLGVRLDPEMTAPEHEVHATPAKSRRVFESRKYARGHVAIYEHLDRRLPKAVVFRDSSSSWLLPLLSESFSRIVAVSSPHVYRELVESEKPDVVIPEIIERYVHDENESPLRACKLPFKELTDFTVDDLARKTGLVVGYVESPTPRSEVGGVLHVHGWAVSPDGIREITVDLDGVPVGNAEMGVSRPDLSAFPCPEAKTSGFRFYLDSTAAGISAGKHRVAVRVKSTRDTEHTLGEMTIRFVL